MTKPISSTLVTASLAVAAIGGISASAQVTSGTAARELFVRTGKSLIIDSRVPVERVAVANPSVAEAVAVTPREVLVNGRDAGETCMIVWQQNGNRMIFDLHVLPDSTKLELIRGQLSREFGDFDIEVEQELGEVYLRGHVPDLGTANRAEMIVSSLSGRLVNLLHVDVPEVETQILLKVRFANVDRTALQELGANYILTGAFNTAGAISTQRFGNITGDAAAAAGNAISGSGGVSLSDALNIFVFRPDLDFGVAIRALQAKNLLQILAEPNVLAINDRPASFLAGGEFPFPVIQGGGFGGAVTIQFREFGVRINFTPHVTARGTIRLEVEPEVSSLDFANGLVLQGFTIPALSTRRVSTEVELESNQSFAIGGLLDNRVTEQLSKVPGLGDIPFFGRLFRARSLDKKRTELIVIVTPEIVRPISAEAERPDVPMVKEFLPGGVEVMPRTPGLDETGPVPIKPPHESLPIEQLREVEQRQQGAPVLLQPIQRPWVLPVGPPEAQPGASSPAAPPAPGGTEPGGQQ